jgi:predicted dehydrogenase
MLRIAIAGAGMVSRHHLRAWAATANATVVAIADPDALRASARATEFGIGASFADPDEMLDSIRPDALDIAAGHAAHRPLCLAAARRGIAVLCQKPLGPTLAEARAIVDGVGSRTRLMIHENWRFRPWYRQAAAWIDDGAIGAPRQLTLSARSSGFLLQGGKRPALERQPMLAHVPRLVIGEVLVHHLDVTCCLLGALQVTAASIQRCTLGVAGETAAQIRLAGQRTHAMVFGDMADPCATEVLTDAMHLVGTEGEIRLDGPTLSLSGRRTQRLDFDLDAGYQRSYDTAIAHFACALLEDRPFATSPEVHLRILALAEDAYRLATGTAKP